MLPAIRTTEAPELPLAVNSLVLRKPSRSVLGPDVKLFIRSGIADAEAVIEALGDGSDDTLSHVDHFADGLYARELFMPAGMIVTSKIHKTNHFAFILRGKIIVIDENSGGELVTAPCMLITKAGTKRILNVLEDSVWVTVHATVEKDVQKIERKIIADDYLDTIEGSVA